MLAELREIDLIKDYLETRLQDYDHFHRAGVNQPNSPLDGPQITNVEIFRAYIAAMLRGRADIHKEMTFLIRSLAPGRSGMPIEVYAFTSTTDWFAYEHIQAEIFEHLLAAAPVFGLRVFQEPTGMDFAGMVSGA